MSRRGRVRIGISGWNYPKWRGWFYPPDCPHKRELEFASRTFETIEVNGSFYSLLRVKAVCEWYERTPHRFRFALKGSRFITHMKRLRDAETPLANFFAAGPLALEDKLGPILWQLPPQLPFDADRLERFFEQLPRSTTAAAKLAARHDARLRDRAYTTTMRDRPIQHAIEVRHSSYVNSAFIHILERHRIALCAADTGGLFPDFEDVTADFVYARLHGDTKLYESGYSVRALERWAKRIRAWSEGTAPDDGRLMAPDRTHRAARRDVYVYFDNDARVRAPFDALTLRAIVRGEKPPRVPWGLGGAGEPARASWLNWTGIRPERSA
jgi:uncharacterized protein YecE (DUF72 family)